jgi:6-phosphogluconate dehydrogenase
MQLICEADAMIRAAGFGTDEMVDIFDEWNGGDL